MSKGSMVIDVRGLVCLYSATRIRYKNYGYNNNSGSQGANYHWKIICHWFNTWTETCAIGQRCSRFTRLLLMMMALVVVVIVMVISGVSVTGDKEIFFHLNNYNLWSVQLFRSPPSFPFISHTGCVPAQRGKCPRASAILACGQKGIKWLQLPPGNQMKVEETTGGSSKIENSAMPARQWGKF